jgi:hypothetical protein
MPKLSVTRNSYLEGCHWMAFRVRPMITGFGKSRPFLAQVSHFAEYLYRWLAFSCNIKDTTLKCSPGLINLIHWAPSARIRIKTEARLGTDFILKASIWCRMKRVEDAPKLSAWSNVGNHIPLNLFMIVFSEEVFRSASSVPSVHCWRHRTDVRQPSVPHQIPRTSRILKNK